MDSNRFRSKYAVAQENGEAKRVQTFLSRSVQRSKVPIQTSVQPTKVSNGGFFSRVIDDIDSGPIERAIEECIENNWHQHLDQILNRVQLSSSTTKRLFTKACDLYQFRMVKVFVDHGFKLMGANGQYCLNKVVENGSKHWLIEFMEMGAERRPEYLAIIAANGRKELLNHFLEKGWTEGIRPACVAAARNGRLKELVDLYNQMTCMFDNAEVASTVNEVLVAAVQSGKLGIVRHFGSLKYPLCSSSSLLLEAVKIGDDDIVKYLVESGCDFDRWDWVIEHASANGHAKLLSFVVRRGNIDHTVLSLAASRAATNGHLNVLQEIFSVTDTIDANNLLTKVFRSKKFDLLFFLFLHGSKENFLHLLASQGLQTDVSELKRRGIVFTDLNQKQLASCLVAAIESGNEDVVAYLLEMDIDRSDKFFRAAKGKVGILELLNRKFPIKRRGSFFSMK